MASKNIPVNDRLILALDVPTIRQARELVEQVTGQSLSHQPLLSYLRGKLEPLYGIG